MGRRRRGLQHMLLIKDKSLEECQPSHITWKDFVVDCEEAVNNPDIHSDEWSSVDEELAGIERKEEKRPTRNRETNSVIKVYDKNGGLLGYVNSQVIF